MTKKHSDYWFKRRRYGWGWIPTTWQGAVVLGAWLLYIIWQLVLVSFETSSNRTIDIVLCIVAVALATVTLLVVSLLKGPRPKWRWGKSPDDRKHEDF